MKASWRTRKHPHLYMTHLDTRWHRDRSQHKRQRWGFSLRVGMLKVPHWHAAPWCTVGVDSSRAQHVGGTGIHAGTALHGSRPVRGRLERRGAARINHRHLEWNSVKLAGGGNHRQCMAVLTQPHRGSRKGVRFVKVLTLSLPPRSPAIQFE